MRNLEAHFSAQELCKHTVDFIKDIEAMWFVGLAAISLSSTTTLAFIALSAEDDAPKQIAAGGGAAIMAVLAIPMIAAARYIHKVNVGARKRAEFNEERFALERKVYRMPEQCLAKRSAARWSATRRRSGAKQYCP